ncbi:tetratricopeptide repeat protein [Paramagnetospirillum marisnigri]|nr:tetratricopeptide repeat protein [Paramagnetospirillum marisnigri]
MQDLIDTALGHHRAGRLDLAVPLYAEALRQRPDHPEAHNNTGNAVRALGQPHQAAIDFSIALELRPDLPEALNKMGVCRQVAGDFGAAMDLFRRAIDLRPTHPETVVNLAQALGQAGQLSDAAKAYGVARNQFPDNADLHTLHGNIPRRLGKIEEASGRDRQQMSFITAKDCGSSFMERYNQADIALDTLPLSGDTIRYHAICMGVAVLTLPGERMVGRWTAAMAGAVGMLYRVIWRRQHRKETL